MKLSDIWDGNNFIISKKAVRTFCKSVKLAPRYNVDEGVLGNFVPEQIHEKSTFEKIYIITTLINSFYSTRMGADDCWNRAELLTKEHARIWPAIHKANVKTVQYIINQQKKSKRPVGFSFTTKYFSILSRHIAGQDIYPIYDSKVAKLLDYYFYVKNGRRGSKHSVSKFNNTNVKDYESYYTMMAELVESCGVSYKDLDNYLWRLGTDLDNNIKGAWTSPRVDMAKVLRKIYKL